jgi:hypothetical protein
VEISRAQDDDPFEESLSGEDDPFNDTSPDYTGDVPQSDSVAPAPQEPSNPRVEIYDSSGRRTGSAVKDGDRWKLYDRNGKRIGTYE